MSGADVALDPDDDLEERLAVVCGHLNALHAQLVALVREALASGCWQQIGIRSPAHWLSWKAGMSHGQAQRVVALADAASTHPAVINEFTTGGLSLEQASIAASVPAYLDGQFADMAPAATVAQLRVLARAARDPEPTTSNADDTTDATASDADSTPRPAPAPPETLVAWFSEDGRYHLRGELDADHGRVVDAALSEARDALFQQGHVDVDWPAALVAIAERSLDHIAEPARRERFRVNWFVNPDDPVPATWSDRLPVPRWLREMLTCDGTVSPVFTDGAHPISVGRTQRTIPDRTRRTVLHRDANRCRVPWCTHSRWLDVHHIVHHEHGGGTDTPNLAALCRYHHRLHHQGHLGIAGNADDAHGLTFTNARGEPLTGAAHPIKPSEPPPPAAPYEHPSGERLQRWAVLFPDPPPAGHAA
jgi:hypothetical protein